MEGMLTLTVLRGLVIPAPLCSQAYHSYLETPFFMGLKMLSAQDEILVLFGLCLWHSTLRNQGGDTDVEPK